MTSKAQFSLEYRTNPRFLWFSFNSLSDWSRKLALHSEPLRFKTKTNGDLPQSHFPALQAVCLFFPSSSHWLTPRDIFPTMIGCCDCFSYGLTTLNREAP